MLTINTTGGGSTTRPLTLTPKGRLTVQLIKVEAAFALLSEAEQADVLAELEPIARVARTRAQVHQPSRVAVPLVAGITV
jgi:hypothetical protein